MQQLKAFYQLMGVPAVKEGSDAKHCADQGTSLRRSGSTLQASRFILFWSGATTAPPSCSFSTCIRGTPPVLGSPSGTTRIVGFDQTEFFDESDKSTSLNESGYLYVPASCENDSNSGAVCRLHVAFHGCEQYVDKIHDLFFRDAGYNAWADADHIIVLYPQAAPWLRLADPSQITRNPKGCWAGGAIRVTIISVRTASRCARSGG
jgi:hypothetical protein